MNNDYIEKMIEENFLDCSFDIRNHMTKVFTNLGNGNNEFMMSFLEIICKIKKEHPKFFVEFSVRDSFFDCNEEKISLGRKNYLILIHEIAHAMHYYYNNYSVFENFNTLQEKKISDSQILNKGNEFIRELDKKIRNITNLAVDTNITDEEYYNMLLEQKCYLEMKDFIDAFFKGRTDSGHGANYYSDDYDNKKAFSEMFATYMSICSFDFSFKMISEFKNLFGTEIMEIFGQLYNEIKEHYIGNDKNKKR